MKKKVALMLIAVLLTILLFPLQAFAQYDKELEKAITTAKTLFNISDSYDEFNYYLNNYMGKTEFSLNWNDSKNKLGTINVTIDTNGKVNNYYSYKPYLEWQRRNLPAISKADGYKTAVQFLLKVNPAVWGNIKYNEETGPINFGDTDYRYNFVRIENGVTYPANQVNITVDNNTNEVRGYYLNWNDDAVFPNTEGIMALDAAEKIYKEKLGLQLVYKMKYDEKTRKPYLVYTNISGNQFIEAKTGEIVRGDSYYGYYGGDAKMAGKSEAAMDAGVSITPQEREAIENAAGIMDKGTAEKTAREDLKIDESYQLGGINLYKDWQNPSDYVWNMYFNKEVKGENNTEYYNSSVSLDAKTGEIISFYMSTPYDKDAVVQLDEAQALEIAKKYVETMYPSRYAEVEYTRWEQQQPIVPLDKINKPRQYSFTFTRKSGGAYFTENGLNITIDTVTSSVIGCSLNWYKGELPSTEKILDLEKAYNILFDTIGLETRYVSVYAQEAYEQIMPRPEPIPAKINLVYAVKHDKPLNIDALTGSLLDYAGQTYIKPEIAQYSDILGHYAEKQINVLAEFGISLPGSTFNPNQNINQKEFLSMLNKAVNPYFILNNNQDDDALYKALINSGIVKDEEKNPNAGVTREEAVKFAVRALRYDKVADIKGIFSLPFKDAGQIKEGLYGYVAIAYGLKIVQGNDGYFNPSAGLTKGQAAVVIYNYLNV